MIIENRRLLPLFDKFDIEPYVENVIKILFSGTTTI
jgi:hypothetical protein